MYIYINILYIYIIYIRFCSKVGFGWNIADINPALFSSTKVQPLIWERSPSRNAKKIQKIRDLCSPNMGLSENSVPLHPMVNDHYPY